MTKLPYVLTQTDKNGPVDHRVAVAAMAEGIDRCKNENVANTPNLIMGVLNPISSSPVAAVQFGLGKYAVPLSWKRQEAFDAARRRNIPVLIIEKGFVKRDEYYHVGWNGLNGYADFRNENSPPDRWAKLGIKLQPHTSRKSYEKILLCGQVPHDYTVQHIDYMAWLRQAYAYLVEWVGEGKVALRPHPLAGKQDYGFVAQHGLDDFGDPIEEVLRHYDLVAAYNSTTLVDAIVAGRTIAAYNDMSVAYPISAYPLNLTRTQWANDLAYSQWTLDEMRSGEAWTHISRGMFT